MKNQEFEAPANGGRIKISELGKSALIQSICFLTSLLMATSSADELFSPLGIAFCSGVKREYTLFSCLGAMLGYIVSNDYLKAFRYVMALIIVYILKAYAGSFEGLKNKIIVPPVIALFATSSTGIVAAATSEFTLDGIFLGIAEAVSSFGLSYFFTVGSASAEKLKNHQSLGKRELTALIISGITAVLSASRISFLGVSPSGAACSYAVMVSAYAFGESGGAVIGTGTALGSAITGSSSVPFCYGFAGLFTGLFSGSGRVLSAMAYIFSYGAMFVFFKGENTAQLAETAIASLLFIATPQKLFNEVKNLTGDSLLTSEGTAVRNMFVSRLKMVKSAVGNVSGTVSRVSEILKDKAPPDTAGVYLRVRDSVCTGCGMYEKCWKSGFPGTVSEFDAVIEEIRKSGNVTPSFVPASLSGRCIRIMSLCDSFNKSYSSYSARLGAQGRINEMRKITVDQFGSVCDMIDDLLSDFEKSARPLGDFSEEIKNSLGIGASVFCRENKTGHLLVNITVPADADEAELSQCVENVTEREFSSPVAVSNGKEKILMLWEKPPFSVECEYYQSAGEQGEICGDCFDSFYDGRGSFVAVLSDGMGTGSRAALDGAMASSLLSRLIVSGFSFSSALKLVNSAMLVKSREESLATLDIVKVDLYTGQCSVYKAGAAQSLLKRAGKISEIKKSAMPIGILREAEFGTARGTLRDNDLLVMMSDGADNSVDEIKAFLRDNAYTSDISQKLCVLAKGRNIGRQDDITVVTVRLLKNC